MVSEYACIVLAPALVLLVDQVDGRRWYNLGWPSAGAPVDATALLLGTALQLCAELVVDLLCVRVEERSGIPVREAWRRAANTAAEEKEDNDGGRGNGGGTATPKVVGCAKRRVVYVWAVGAAVAIAAYFLLRTFVTRPPDVCQPYPCHQCMAAGGLAGGEHLTSGKGDNPQLVHWCKTRLPGVGGNATYFCKDAGDVRADANLAGLTAAQAARCT